MTITPVHEAPERDTVIALPPPSPWERAAEVARRGHVAWLAEDNRESFALLPSPLAHAALEALEEAQDMADIAERADEPSIPWEQVEADLDELNRQGR